MKIFTILAALALLSVPCFAQRSGAAASEGLLPQSFGGFALSGKAAEAGAADLERIAGPQAPIMREYGVTSAEQASYAEGAENASIRLYRMADPTAAFGLFTFLRTPDMAPFMPSPGVAYAARAKDRSVLVIGNLVLDVTSARPKNDDWKALVAGLGPYADRTPYPTIAGYLPQAGLVPNSERYVLGPQALAQAFPEVPANAGNWIGFDKNAEAIVAHYRLKGQPQGTDSLLLVALYPTQQVAAEKYGQLSQWMRLNDQGSADNNLPVVFGKQSGSLVALLGGVESKDSASALLDQIQYTPQVTWNEPSRTFSDPGIGTMVVEAFLGTGAIMLMAIAAGIGFGGIRLFVKFLFPGKVFDRDNQVEILQLGLSSKRIEAKDFYLIDPPKGN